MIEISGVTKVYKMGENTLSVLKGVSLRIEDGDFVAIMGPSGSGKSTLMNILGLLDVPTEGSYKFNGREVSKLTPDELAVLRREEIGFIFQQFNLLARMTAKENVNLPLLYSRKQDSGHLALDLLGKVGLAERVNHKPNELSGGQQQRVAIARSLVNSPRVVLADEPTGNLDSVSQKEILNILKNLQAQGITVIIVTHEEEIGAQAHRLIRVRDGLIQSDERLAPLAKRPQETALVSSQGDARRGFFHELVEHFRQGFKTLSGNKVRTALSMLGILIGVGAVVAMLALGKGAQKAIESQLSSLGSNLLNVRPAATRVGGVSQESGGVTRLSIDDVNLMKERVAHIQRAAPVVSGRGQVTYLNNNWNTSIQGVTDSYPLMHNSVPVVGRFFTESENLQRAKVAVIGRTLVRELFGETNPIGEVIKINRIGFQVVGVLPEKGATGFRDQDDIVYIPVMTAMRRLLGKDYVDYIEIEVDQPENIASVTESITQLMANRHKVPESQKEEALQIRNMADIQEALSESSRTMSLLLAAIAAISLIVGGIGIMNIMLVSVTERTREIGLRKAIGARERDILFQFLAESVVVTVVGGLAGISLGVLITTILSSLVGWTTSVSAESMLLSFFFSAIIGVVFGVYPARKASKLHPIQALRYE